MGLEEKLPSGVLLTTIESVRLHAERGVLAGHLRSGVLRHRDDDLRRATLRLRPVGTGSVPRLASRPI